jgi:3D (Asp-Asp-Asp) domain-containing protein
MRYFYSVLILLAGMILPLLACAPKGDAPTPTTSTKAGTHYTPPVSVASAAPAKTEDVRKAWLVITPRLADASAAMTSRFRDTADAAAEAIGQVGSRLARVTAYWACEGDYYTRHGISATGVRLHDGHCAVDPNIIPYGSVVNIAGVGKFLAVDTGSAVVDRTAAREGGHTRAERSAIVVDLFFESRREGERFAASDAKYVAVSWWTPGSNGAGARAARSLFAEEDWTKIESKQL